MAAEKKSKNPFEHDPEQVLQERMKHARKITRDEFLNPNKQENKKAADEKK
jgi:hypothetical protein